MDKRTALLLAAGLLVVGLLGWLLMPDQAPTTDQQAAETPAPPEDAQAPCTLTIDLPDALDTSVPHPGPGTSVEDPLCLEQRAGDLDLQPEAEADLPRLERRPAEG